jgi:SAM-dependent methyltransferase
MAEAPALGTAATKLVTTRQRGKKAAVFEKLWRHDDAGWANLGSTEWQAVYERQIAMIDGRSYARALEIGCGAGFLSVLLARVTNQLVALDIAPTAIGHARTRLAGPGLVDFRVANIMEYDIRAEGPWDLIVMSDTIYSLGSVYTFFEIAWLGAEMFAATSHGGRFLLANASSAVKDEDEDEDMRPWVIRTYRDLFLNVGYCLEKEEIFPANYRGVGFQFMSSCFVKG